MEKIKITQAIYDNYKKHFDLQLDETKKSIYKKYMDELSCEMTRKKTLGLWTEQDDLNYKATNDKCLKEIDDYIKQSDINNFIIISEEEYAKMEEEERKKREEEEKLRLLEEQQKNSLLEQIEEVNNGEQ